MRWLREALPTLLLLVIITAGVFIDVHTPHRTNPTVLSAMRMISIAASVVALILAVVLIVRRKLTLTLALMFLAIAAMTLGSYPRFHRAGWLSVPFMLVAIFRMRRENRVDVA